MNGDPNPASASSGASATNAFAPLTSSRPSPFPATTVATKNMAVPAFLPPQQPFRAPATSQPAYLPSLPTASSSDRDTKKPLGTPLSATPPTLSSALIRKLPLNTSEESLRLMVVFSKDLVDVEVLPVEQSADAGFRSAILKFKTPAGAQEVKNMLDGKSNISNDAEMIVEILGSSSPTALSKRFPNESVLPAGASVTAATSAATTAPSSRQTSRFNGTFQSLEKISTPMNGLGGHEGSAPFQSIFGPQSPIGNHLANGTQVSSRSLIDSADDDETRELIKDPVGFAENGLQRRQTAPQLPISRMASLSLNTTPTPPPSHAMTSYFGHPGMPGLSGMPSTMSPTAMGGVPGPGLGYTPHPPYRVNNFPPANPADQNPPCNTLYVGNLPLDTSEEELKAMFSKQRGYKRLCFRTKQNGPMCFVEFEDVTFATKALHELYGQPLHNSVKGGIRLSFSKNPLGVRSGQNTAQNGNGSMGGMNGMHPGSTNGFTTASGPPPGLTAPPGLGMNRGGYTASSGLGSGASSMYGSPTVSNPPSNPWGGATLYNSQGHMMTGATSTFPPPYMMGR
ncbi:hypothetical protein VTK26DRAFT_392 [Humicola hyalothermophila]